MIKKPNELDFDGKRFNAIIAGVPGIGKTTLALSAPKPLLVDFDGGVMRVDAFYRKDTLTAKDAYEAVQELEASDLGAYETIVIDTAGKMLDTMKAKIMAKDRKNVRGQDNTLSLQGYGALKRDFADLSARLKRLNKHIVWVCHATEVTLPNEGTGLRIRMEGSSKDDIWDDIDIGGFMEMQGKERNITFGNSERFYAKGTHGIHGTYQVPTLGRVGGNTFLADLFKEMAEELKSDSDATEAYKAIMAKGRKAIGELSLQDAYEAVKALPEALTSKPELWAMLKEKAKAEGKQYDKTSDAFI